MNPEASSRGVESIACRPRRFANTCRPGMRENVSANPVRIERAQARALNMRQVGFGRAKQMRSRAVRPVRCVQRMHARGARTVSACDVVDVMHGRPPAPYPCGSRRRHAAGCRVIEADRSGNECTNSAKDHPFSAIVRRKRKRAGADTFVACLLGTRNYFHDLALHRCHESYF